MTGETDGSTFGTIYGVIAVNVSLTGNIAGESGYIRSVPLANPAPRRAVTEYMDLPMCHRACASHRPCYEKCHDCAAVKLFSG